MRVRPFPCAFDPSGLMRGRCGWGNPEDRKRTGTVAAAGGSTTAVHQHTIASD